MSILSFIQKEFEKLGYFVGREYEEEFKKEENNIFFKQLRKFFKNKIYKHIENNNNRKYKKLIPDRSHRKDYGILYKEEILESYYIELKKEIKNDSIIETVKNCCDFEFYCDRCNKIVDYKKYKHLNYSLNDLFLGHFCDNLNNLLLFHESITAAAKCFDMGLTESDLEELGVLTENGFNMILFYKIEEEFKKLEEKKKNIIGKDLNKKKEISEKYNKEKSYFFEENNYQINSQDESEEYQEILFMVEHPIFKQYFQNKNVKYVKSKIKFNKYRGKILNLNKVLDIEELSIYKNIIKIERLMNEQQSIENTKLFLEYMGNINNLIIEENEQINAYNSNYSKKMNYNNRNKNNHNNNKNDNDYSENVCIKNRNYRLYKIFDGFTMWIPKEIIEDQCLLKKYIQGDRSMIQFKY